MGQTEIKLCKRGHPRLPENIDSWGSCKICRNERRSTEEYRANNKVYMKAYHKNIKEMNLDFEKEFAKKMSDIYPALQHLETQVTKPLHKKAVDILPTTTLAIFAKEMGMAPGIALNVVKELHTESVKAAPSPQGDKPMESGVKMWAEKDLIEVNREKYVRVTEANAALEILTDDFNMRLELEAQKAEAARKQILGQVRQYKIKRISEIRTCNGNFLEMTFDHRPTDLSPGNTVTITEVDP